ncbi:Golgi phosphoprotein 3 (GPP34) [Actinacidiphila yanglinensis]|uniref:Golgi phosphoprotein 3 (GPP34) n=1 Tax=Actinacidiphila yanglinensis TaxID=310779 RepID=A0A1H5X7X1_9ACTN|nr:GPP34 family phosphoprotein [Actinacidiphila yanglinensis]SEG07829.1 Golgi phosphoprotein 3 (GPP34) [Actinacidiphila yanglinensis]
MTTSRDLLIVTMDDAAAGSTVDPDDLSLALAGAELVDLVGAGAITLDGERIVPGAATATGDRLLDRASSSVLRQEPYETVDHWLWRRGDTLSAEYVAALEADGDAVRPRHRWIPVRSDRLALVDSPARVHAAERWASGDPVLSLLAVAAGVPARPTDTADRVTDEVTVTVVDAVNQAVTELEARRQRRKIEKDAFDNIWRAP